MNAQKNIALVAHDHRKKDMIEWVEWNVNNLLQHRLTCTGTTGRLVEKAIQTKLAGLAMPDDFSIVKLHSGPLGGDQQLGALITEGKIDLIIFFWDPMQPQPHDVDVKALLRIAVLYNVPIACNRSTADFIISSPLMTYEYAPIVPSHEAYLQRELVADSREGRRVDAIRPDGRADEAPVGASLIGPRWDQRRERENITLN
ncbi:MAG: methylglyoxal synthase [Candidatus Competibacteraceae bacterium]|nr:methylglyoxal synthase [Candidatus Competibacteraceae bacterium]